MLSRRHMIAALAATAAPVPGWAALGHPVALSAVRLPSGEFALTGLQDDGTIAFTVPLPMRGHAGAAHPTAAEAVAIARRPGTRALVVDCLDGTIIRNLAAPEGRHFYGHGAFSEDGKFLFTTENDFATGEGHIGVWDRTLGYERVDEFLSGGIGPHEIIRLPNDILAVANGGIRTHPDHGREKLNLDTMRSNLTLFRTSGAVLDQVEANAQMNSLRHIAQDADGGIVVGYQWQGDPFEAPALVGRYKDGALTDMGTDEITIRQLTAYVGSVSAHRNGAVISSPVGGRVQIFDATGNLQLSLQATDVCGLCPTSRGALATDGTGGVYRVTDDVLLRIAKHNLAFDNHLIPL